MRVLRNGRAERERVAWAMESEKEGRSEKVRRNKVAQKDVEEAKPKQRGGNKSRLP